jgi:hypothetical protein
MKTAVEWLHEQFKAGFNYNIEEGYEKRRDELFEEAKEMEKEQKIDFALTVYSEIVETDKDFVDVIKSMNL